MKKVLFAICMGSLALAMTAWGQSTNTNDVRQARARHSQTTSKAERAAPTNSRRAVTNTQPVRSQRYISTAPSRQRSYVTTPRTNVNANASARYNTTRNSRLHEHRAHNFRSTLHTRSGGTLQSHRCQTLDMTRKV